LKPFIVYELTLHAPFSSSPTGDLTSSVNQQALTEKLERQGARRVTFTTQVNGIDVKLEQSFQEPTTLTFGTGSFDGAVPVAARRLDGLDWNAA
jgi:hypothetical protein